MRVLFDFEVDGKPNEIEAMYTGENSIFLTLIKEFVEQKLNSFDEDINWQEAYTIIHITAANEIKITHHNIEPLLEYKISRAFSIQNYEYLSEKIRKVQRPGKNL